MCVYFPVSWCNTCMSSCACVLDELAPFTSWTTVVQTTAKREWSSPLQMQPWNCFWLRDKKVVEMKTQRWCSLHGSSTYPDLTAYRICHYSSSCHPLFQSLQQSVWGVFSFLSMFTSVGLLGSLLICTGPEVDVLKSRLDLTSNFLWSFWILPSRPKVLSLFVVCFTKYWLPKSCRPCTIWLYYTMCLHISRSVVNMQNAAIHPSWSRLVCSSRWYRSRV